MKRGFYTIMAAQFFSSLADNALFVAAVELIRISGGAEWERAALVPMFALFYVVLAPYVGAFADSRPKGEVMFLSNAIKVVGCLMMLFGTHPLLSYAIVGLGAAAYSPAKYGILTELLPSSQLVKANGWIEGLTIASIILGVLVGGQLVGTHVSEYMLSFDLPMLETGIDTAPEAAILLLITFYALAAWFNTWPCVTCRKTNWPCCLIFGIATPASGKTAWVKFRCQQPHCFGASPAICAISCWHGVPPPWGTPPRKPPAWSASWPLARRSGPWWPLCA